MYIGYKRAIELIIKENSTLDLNRISIEHLQHLKEIRLIAKLFYKREIDVASDVYRAFVKLREAV